MSSCVLYFSFKRGSSHSRLVFFGVWMVLLGLVNMKRSLQIGNKKHWSWIPSMISNVLMSTSFLIDLSVITKQLCCLHNLLQTNYFFSFLWRRTSQILRKTGKGTVYLPRLDYIPVTFFFKLFSMGGESPARPLLSYSN